MNIDILDSAYIVWERTPTNDILFKRNTISFDSSINLSNPAEPLGYAAVAATQYNVYVICYGLSPVRFPEIFYRRSTDGGANFGWTTNLTDTGEDSFTPAVAAFNDLT
jgi:hypothetical protein